MRRSDIAGLLRAIIMLVLVALIAIECKTEQKLRGSTQEPPVWKTLSVMSIPASASAPDPEPVAEPEPEWTSLGSFKLTAYCPCEKCCGYWATIRPKDEAGNPIVYTATGAVAEAGTTIAVDPDIIPYGTKVKINGHIYIAQDTGGAINGSRIDVYHDDHAAALTFGVQEAEVFILKEDQ